MDEKIYDLRLSHTDLEIIRAALRLAFFDGAEEERADELVRTLDRILEGTR